MLERAQRRAPAELNASATQLAAEEMDHIVTEWFSEVLQSPPVKADHMLTTRGRLACDPKRNVAPVVRKGVTTVTMRTEDPRAVTCPRCMASSDYLKAMEILQQN